MDRQPKEAEESKVEDALNVTKMEGQLEEEEDASHVTRMEEQQEESSFNPMRIKPGGSLQDQIVYNVGNIVDDCPQFENSTNGLFGFSNGCLTMKRWDEISALFGKSGSQFLRMFTGRTSTLSSLSGLHSLHYRLPRCYLKAYHPECVGQGFHILGVGASMDS